MRKAFKVATVFTGAAACAAAFAPAAGAATAARTQPAEPATSHHNCGGGRTTSTVFWWPSAAHHGPTCVGGYNNYHSVTFLDTYYSGYCPGDNYGWFNGRIYHYSPSKHKFSLHHVYVSDVSITGWSHAANTCST